MTERLYERDAYLTECDATVVRADATGIVLDRTVFYAAGGGQPGDVGKLILGDGLEIEVVDTLKGEGDDILHVPAANERPDAGTPVRAVIDWKRRHRHMRMHTCMHLLCSLIDAPVTGGNLGADRGRLDFDLPQPTVDRQTLTERLNALIQGNHRIGYDWIEDAELDARPELVRTLAVAPPRGAGRIRLVNVDGVDVQPCGGTHVANTAEIGRVRVSKIEKKSRHNRRVVVVFEE